MTYREQGTRTDKRYGLSQDVSPENGFTDDRYFDDEATALLAFEESKADSLVFSARLYDWQNDSDPVRLREFDRAAFLNRPT